MDGLGTGKKETEYEVICHFERLVPISWNSIKKFFSLRHKVNFTNKVCKKNNGKIKPNLPKTKIFSLT